MFRTTGTSSKDNNILPSNEITSKLTLKRPVLVLILTRVLTGSVLFYLAFKTFSQKHLRELEYDINLQLPIVCLLLGLSDVCFVFSQNKLFLRLSLFFQTIGFPWLLLCLVSVFEACEAASSSSLQLLTHGGTLGIGLYSLYELSGVFVYLSGSNSSMLSRVSKGCIFVGEEDVLVKEKTEWFGLVLIFSLLLGVILNRDKSIPTLTYTSLCIIVFNIATLRDSKHLLVKIGKTFQKLFFIISLTLTIGEC